MPEPLTLHAECFMAAGGMTADGMKKLLGTPALSLLETVIRETVQNSWDARREDFGVGYRIRLRELRPKELAILQEEVFDELPPHKSSAKGIRQFLDADRQVVMEISDWQTAGLGGPVRADRIPERGEANDFVNFVRNMGARRDVAGGGGTYGYGKSSLYQLSRCSTVLIDTVTLSSTEKPINRFIACHLGEAHDMRKHGRLTGRHWWGTEVEDEDVVDPVTGQQAARLRRLLGLPDRDDGLTGTTLVVLDPVFDDDLSLKDIGAQIQEALLWYFWPKMLPGPDGELQIGFEVEVDGDVLPLPAPEQFPPLDLFVEAYRCVKDGGPNLYQIDSERPIRHLGKCSIRRGFRQPRRYLVPEDESLLPSSSAHIAVMRPVELVVKYVEGTQLPSDTVEWAGVFICNDDKEVEQAFADAEPPAHDDWIPDQMPKSWAKTYVRVALSRLKYLATSYAYPGPGAASGASEQPPLARAADRLGNCMPMFGNAGAGGGRPGGGGFGGGSGGSGGRRAGRRQWHIGEPRFRRIEEGTDGLEAVFQIDVANSSDHSLRLVATPAAVMDGALADTEDDDQDVSFICWEDDAGTQLTTSTGIVAASNSDTTLFARIGFPDDGAAGLRVTATEQAS